jgi:tRNA modification GTPase
MHHMQDDTIAAISTPFGEGGGISIIRVSGKDAITIADSFFYSPHNTHLKTVGSHTIHHGFIIDRTTGEKIDEVLASVMHKPKTYTREDVVEINCHGGSLVARTILKLLIQNGARLAEPGEFTKRAFLNGRIDLSQAEAVMDLITAKTDYAKRIALQHLDGRLSEKIALLRSELIDLCAHVEAYIDFPEDDMPDLVETELLLACTQVIQSLKALSDKYNEGRLYREGAVAAIIGKPNVGKSSMLNALVDADRAIVTEFPGTTRDIIEEYINIRGVPLRIMDTAGIRETEDYIEQEGVRRSLQAIESADIIIMVIDGSDHPTEADRKLLNRIEKKRLLLVINKADVLCRDFRFDKLGISTPFSPTFDMVEVAFENGDVAHAIVVSAKTGQNIEQLKEAIKILLVSPHQTSLNSSFDDVIVTNIRHKQAIDKAAEAMEHAFISLKNHDPEEITVLSLREALESLGEIIGVVSSEDILDRIFNKFCIGK